MGRDKEKVRDQNRKHYEKNGAVLRQKQTEYRAQNQEKVNTSVRSWRARNPNYDAERCARDPDYRLRKNLRSRVSHALRRNQKGGSAVDDLGCTIPELIFHLEQQFDTGMTWENYGRRGWHIDHRIPLKSFDLTDPEQFARAVHYENLQPKWWRANLSKSASLEPPSLW